MPLSSYGYEGRCRVELQIISAHGAYHLNFFRRTARVSNVYIKKIAVHTSPFPRQSHNSREHFPILTLTPPPLASNLTSRSFVRTGGRTATTEMGESRATNAFKRHMEGAYFLPEDCGYLRCN